MSGPLTTRDALAEAILGHIVSVTNLPEWMRVPALGRDLRPLAEGIAVALLASGALIDAGKLAEDEAVVGYVENFVPLGFRPGRDPYANVSEAARGILTALAHALSASSEVTT